MSYSESRSIERNKCSTVLKGAGKVRSEYYSTKLKYVCKRLRTTAILVEAAGVEPASENVTSQETTCVVGSCFRPSPETFAALAQNRQETSPASLRISPPQPRRSRESQPAV